MLCSLDKINLVCLFLAILFSVTVNGITKVVTWLRDMVLNCNGTLGSPYEKCMAAFEKGYDDCTYVSVTFYMLPNSIVLEMREGLNF